MKLRILEKAALAAIAVSAACGTPPDEATRENITAGAASQALGIRAYQTERAGGSVLIHLIAEGNRDAGTIELRQLEVGEVGADGQVIEAWMLAREPLVRVWYRSRNIDREVATIVGVQRPGIDCPVVSEVPKLLAQEPWSAALTDPALVAVLDTIELRVELDTRADVRPSDVAFNHDCAGHNTNHLSGYNYDYCSTSGPQQSVYWISQYNCGEWARSTRACYGSTAMGGNGHLYAGWQSCCNNSCPNPSPAGASTRADCTGLGGAGCGSVTNTYGCNHCYCIWDCQNNCGYSAECCGYGT